MKLIFLFSSIFLVTLSLTTSSKIASSHHDFSGQSWANNEICIVCHTPHNASTTFTDAPLWNHQVTSATFQIYSSNTLNATIGQPIGPTKLCLSCHDGTVAYDNYGTSTSGTRFISSTNAGYLGTDLRHEHPVSFEYNTALAASDGGLYDPSAQSSGLGGTIANDLLMNGRLECTSCHDVHIKRNTAGTCTGCHSIHPMRTTSLSLRKSNTGSALCLTCHIK